MNPADITADLRDIKPAIEIPEIATGLSPYAIAAIIAATVLLLAAIVWWLLRSRMRRSQADPVADALLDLEHTRRLMDLPDAASYVVAVSDVLRHYIERHLGAKAAHQTSDEFLASLSEAELSPIREHRSALREFLAQCDLVKFARGELGKEEREALHTCAWEFIEATAERRQDEATDSGPASGVLRFPSSARDQRARP